MTSLIVDLDRPIARITLDHPPGNRIDFAMREDLRDAVRRVAQSPARALVIRGAGADFCRGGDVRDWPGIPSSMLQPKIAMFAEALEALRKLDIPTVAVVQGACRGGGFELALSCDAIVASRSAHFCFPEVNSGILTLQGGAMQLAQRIGRTKALELVLLGEPVDAEQMQRWAAINHVVDDDALDDTAARFVTRLADADPSVCAATKQLLRLWSAHGESAAMASWYDLSMPLFDNPATQAALHAAADAIARTTKGTS